MKTTNLNISNNRKLSAQDQKELCRLEEEARSLLRARLRKAGYAWAYLHHGACFLPTRNAWRIIFTTSQSASAKEVVAEIVLSTKDVRVVKRGDVTDKRFTRRLQVGT